MTRTELIFSTITEVETEQRTVKGIAVPYGEITNKYGYPETFAKGAFSDEPLVQVFYQHDSTSTPIGRVQSYEDTDAGLVITAKISSTPKGDEVYTLLKEGVLDAFSIGVYPTESFEDDNGTTVHTKAELLEVSIVNTPAFDSARVSEVHNAESSEVRSEITNKDESEEKADSAHMEYEKEIGEIRSELEQFARDLSLSKEKESAPKAVQFNSGGEFLKALASGNESAKSEAKSYAFTGATTGDSVVKPEWIDRGLELIKVNRKAFDLFSHKSLPVSGNSIEYPLVSSVSGSVGRQIAEGDDLTYSEVVLTTATAPVHTYGGYTSISRQAIERSTVSYLETALDHLARNYGRATNTAVLTAATGASGVNTGTGITLSSGTAVNWIGFVNEGVQAIEDNGLGAQAEFMWVSRDVFNKVSTLVDTTGRPLMSINGDGTNTVGGADLRNISGTSAGVPVVVDGGLPAKTAFMGAKEAVEIYENSGAPYSLADENIINLTKDFSLYGYMAIAVPNPKALFKVAVA